ncbi:replication protein, partial [Vibrio fluvialis]|nr:replication protein [Vibrio fluvialis]
VKLVFNISLDNAVKHAKTQYGKLINAMRQIFEDDTRVLEALTRGFEPTDIPDRINYPVGRAFHQQKTGELQHV